MQLAETVRGHLAAHDIEQALEVLIAAWQKTRALVLAELVDAIDRADATPAFAGSTDDWLATAKAATTHRERGALLRSIADRGPHEVHQCLIVAQAWQDPRLSREILALLSAMPFSGRRTRDIWRSILGVARSQQDVRFSANADRLVESWNLGADLKRFLTNRLAEAIRGFTEPTLPADETAALTALIAGQPAPTKRAVAEDELLAAIYASPDDDGPRLVYADWLQERDDPRGTFIAKQLREPAAKKAPAKLRNLLAGPIAKMIGADSEFRRGFLTTAFAKFRHQRDVEQYGGDPAWSTVEDLRCIGGGTARYDQRAWTQYIGPAMANVRRVKDVHPTWLLAAERPWRIEQLELSRYSVDQNQFRALLGSPLLPSLAHVIVEGGMPAEWLAGVRQCPAHLSFWGSFDSIPERLRYANRTTATMFTLIMGNTKYDYVRDERGVFTPLAR